MTKTIELTEEEANVLLKALDVTVKTQGLVSARACLHMHDRLQAAFKPEEKGDKKDGDAE